MQPFNNLILLRINLSFWIVFKSIFIIIWNILINDQQSMIWGHTLLILTIYTYLTTHFYQFYNSHIFIFIVFYYYEPYGYVVDYINGFMGLTIAMDLSIKYSLHYMCNL